MTSNQPERPFSAILGRFPDLRALSDRLAVPYATVASWKRRDSIPARYWRGVAKAARSMRVTEASYEDLSRALDAKKTPPRAGA